MLACSLCPAELQNNISAPSGTGWNLQKTAGFSSLLPPSLFEKQDSISACSTPDSTEQQAVCHGTAGDWAELSVKETPRCFGELKEPLQDSRFKSGSRVKAQTYTSALKRYPKAFLGTVYSSLKASFSDMTCKSRLQRTWVFSTHTIQWPLCTNRSPGNSLCYLLRNSSSQQLL